MRADGRTFQIATWNVLATSYIQSKFYPRSPPNVLDPEWRVPALVERARELGVDILCLQEVERSVFAAFKSALTPLGYSGTFALKGAEKPDGCATFFRTSCCQLVSEQRLVYADGSPNSGHIAQVLDLNLEGARLALVNTHFKWDAPQTPPELQLGLHQTKLAIAALRDKENSSDIQIICGDFNATPDSNLVEFLIDAGFDYTHRHCSNAFTCNSNNHAKVIDYIFFRGPVEVEPEPLLPIDGQTILPSLEQPSDHLPLTARIMRTRD